MATGTGLPPPPGGEVLAQAPGGTNAAALFNADSWNKIAAAGDELGPVENQDSPLGLGVIQAFDG